MEDVLHQKETKETRTETCRSADSSTLKHRILNLRFHGGEPTDLLKIYISKHHRFVGRNVLYEMSVGSCNMKCRSTIVISRTFHCCTFFYHRRRLRRGIQILLWFTDMSSSSCVLIPCSDNRPSFFLQDERKVSTYLSEVGYRLECKSQ